MTIAHALDGWESPHEPIGLPRPLTYDRKFVGWALGGWSEFRSREFLKSDMNPQTIWPSWAEVSAEDWTSTWHAKPADPPSWFTRSNAEEPSFLRSLWPEEIYRPIERYRTLAEREPSLRDRAKGLTGSGENE